MIAQRERQNNRTVKKENKKENKATKYKATKYKDEKREIKISLKRMIKHE